MWVIAAALDPSAESNETNCFKAWIALAQRLGDVAAYCVDAWIRHASLEECIHHQWELEDRFPGVQIGVERNGAQSWYWPHYKLMCEMHRRPVVRMTPIHNHLPKPVRINSLMGEAEAGRLRFDVKQGDQGRLIDQFLDFPAGDFIDGPDAYEMARRMLKKVAQIAGWEAEQPVTAEEIAAAELLERAEAKAETAAARRDRMRQAAARPDGDWDPFEDPWLDARNDALFEAID